MKKKIKNKKKLFFSLVGILSAIIFILSSCLLFLFSKSEKDFLIGEQENVRMLEELLPEEYIGSGENTVLQINDCLFLGMFKFDSLNLKLPISQIDDDERLFCLKSGSFAARKALISADRFFSENIFSELKENDYLTFTDCSGKVYKLYVFEILSGHKADSVSKTEEDGIIQLKLKTASNIFLYRFKFENL